jgi:hypothetical protein
MVELMLDLERCPFLRPLNSQAEPELSPSPRLGCAAAGEPIEIGLAIQRDRCWTSGHASCPALLGALEHAEPNGWSRSCSAVEIIAGACYLAEARLEVRAERAEPVLERLFGGAR